MNLYRINLNLLIALDILLKEKNVTRAAKKLFISQAAMSNNLKQLRKIFKNELLVREKNKMTLTSYAIQLQPKLHRTLEELDSLVESSQSFEPSTCNKTFKVGMPDILASLILPELVTILQNKAPGIKINIVPLTQMYSAEPFDREDYDIGIARASPLFPLPPSIIKELIISDPGILVLNARHPLAKKKKITLADYAACKHVAWRTDNPDFPSVVNQFLEQQGLPLRNTILHLPYIDSLFRLIEKSDYLVARITKLSESLLKEKYDCVIKACPTAAVFVDFYIAWHIRFNDDKAHQWLRNQIIDILKKI